VICVGGLGFNSRSESIGSAFGAPGFGSNFGSGGLGDGTVDIWAPGVSVRVGLDPSPTTFITPNGVQMVSGTSVATPQVAGVIALVAAANPSLSEAAIESVLLGSAQAAAITPGKSKPVERMLAAEPAVATALGGDRPPELRITAPTAGSYSRGVVHATAFVSDDLSAPTVHWFVDGMEVKTGTNVDLELYAFPFGKYRITATAVDSHGWRTPDADGGVTISLTNDAPTMSISMPAPGAVYFFSFNRFTGKLTGDRVCLQGTSYDPNNKPAQLADSQVRWEIDGGAFTRGGHSAGIDAAALGVGTHTVRFVGTDDGGLSGAASTSIEVREGLVASSGFTVVC
jgi:subtilisin family serine protease